MNYFRKLKLRRLFKDRHGLEELHIMYPEHTKHQIRKAVSGVKRSERI